MLTVKQNLEVFEEVHYEATGEGTTQNRRADIIVIDRRK